MDAPPLSLLALGFAVGFVSGMFGVGGGFLLTPLLNIVMGVPYAIAVGSGMCQMVGTAVSAFLRHRELGYGEPKVAVLMLGGGVLGVHLGTDVVQHLNTLGQWSVNGRLVPAAKLILQPAYVIVLAGTAALLVADWLRARPGDTLTASRRPGPLTRVAMPPYVSLKEVGLFRVSAPLLAYLGLVMGFLSGLLGIGGGVALMPVLMYGLGFPIRQAAGTGILVLLGTVMVGTLEHAFAGHVDLRIAVLLLIASTIGAQLGALTTHRMRGPQLRAWFAVVLLVTVVVLLADLVQQLR